jgi:hypothetical protein
MATVQLTSTTLSVHLTRGEKIGGLLRDLEIPVTAVRSVEVVDQPIAELHGLRAPGFALPGRRKIGTWRRRGERTFVSIRNDQPAIRVHLSGQRFNTLLVGADDAARLAAALSSAA